MPQTRSDSTQIYGQITLLRCTLRYYISQTKGQILYEYLRITPWATRKRNISLIRYNLVCKTTRVQNPWPRATTVTVALFRGPHRNNHNKWYTWPPKLLCIFLNIYVIYKCGRVLDTPALVRSTFSAPGIIIDFLVNTYIIYMQQNTIQ
jgi:hypothetical protein